MKKVPILFFAVLLAFAFTACGAVPDSSVETSVTGVGASQPAAPMMNIPTQDRAGNPIAVPEKVEKIVSLSASNTQILCDLGLGGNLVAIDTYSLGNLSAEVPADVVQLDMMAPDLEQLAALEPDIIFVSNLSSAGADDIFAPLRAAGVCVADVPTPSTVAAILEDVHFLADCTGKSEEGRQLVADANDSLAKAAALLAQIEERPAVYFEVGPAPNLYSTGAGTYLNELITLAGGLNIFADQEGWLAVTEESVVAAKPDVIFTAVDYMPEPVDEILARPGWENVPAIKNAQVYQVDAKTSQQPTHHVVEAVWEMLHYLHPELAQQAAA